MSGPQQAEESVTYANFLQLLSDAEDIELLGVYSGGTRAWVRTRGIWRAFLISDLTAPVAMKLIANDESTYTNTVTATPAKSLSISANSFSKIMIEAEVELDGDLATRDEIKVSFTPDAGHFWFLEQASVVGQAAVLQCRASYVYTNNLAHTASVNVTVAVGAATYFVYPFRAWGIP